MAKSPSHKFGQILGEVLEAAVEPLLRSFAAEYEIYLDKKGKRPTRKGRRKISWIDVYENPHDLDFVLERGGTASNLGTPMAFIETAWRRYTRHSKNKAQEIQGAVLPLVFTHQSVAPFIGAVLAGDFTSGALKQLRSMGFKVLYFPYSTATKAFGQFGIDATYDEDTPDAVFAQKVQSWESLTEDQRTSIAKSLLASSTSEVNQFMGDLRLAVERRIETVVVVPLHGITSELSSVEEAIVFIQNYSELDNHHPVVKYEIEVKYNNGDKVRAECKNKDSAVIFLRGLPPAFLSPKTSSMV
jgi:hypothetical protein